MKKILFLILFLSMSSLCFADCKGVVVSIEKGDRGVILVKSQYFLDGKLLETGKQDNVDVVTYFPKDLQDITKEQIKQKINDDIKNRCNQIITEAYRKTNLLPQEQISSDIADEILENQLKDTQDLIGLEVIVNEVPIMVDSENVGVYDKTVYIQSSGSRREEIISNPVSISVAE